MFDSKFAVRIIIITAAIGLFMMCAVAMWWMLFHAGVSGPELTLPMVIVGGVLALVLMLSLTTVVFASLNMSDPKQALGLPEGSVRSVIALSLILLFAIVAIFMYSNLSATGKIESTPPLTQEARDLFKKGIPNAQYLFDQPTEMDTETKYIVFYRQVANPAAEDFAKQVMAILATLVTAVSSFYFGAKAASPVAVKGQEQSRPVIQGINPNKIARGTSAKLELTGYALDLVKEVKIAFHERKVQIMATDIVSDTSSVTCTLSVDPDAPQGAWDVIVTDEKGMQAKLAGVLTVT